MRGHILHYLENKGYVKRPELLLHLHNLGIDCNDRAMRKEIETMIEQDGHLIMSSEKGYKLIQDYKELKDAMEYLRKKATAIVVRANYLTHNWNMRKENQANQMSLFEQVDIHNKIEYQ